MKLKDPNFLNGIRDDFLIILVVYNNYIISCAEFDHNLPATVI